MHMTFRHLLLTHTAEFFGIIWRVLLRIGSGSLQKKSIFVCLFEVRAAVGLTEFLITGFTPSGGSCFILASTVGAVLPVELPSVSSSMV